MRPLGPTTMAIAREMRRWSLAAAPLVTGGGEDLVVGAPLVRVTDKHLQAGRVYVFGDHGGLVPHQAIDEAALSS